MKVCFDTCVLIDICGATEWFKDSFVCYDIVQLRHDDALMSIHSTADLDYVLHRRGMTREKAREAVALVGEMFDFIDLIPSDGALALQSDMRDYEDALIAFSATRVGADLIITRDEGFKNSPIPAISPEEFVVRYCPEGYEYDLVKLG